MSIRDPDKVATRCARMWWRIGTLLEKRAVERAEQYSARDTMTYARAAEVCFWQATGEMNSAEMKEFVSSGDAK